MNAARETTVSARHSRDGALDVLRPISLCRAACACLSRIGSVLGVGAPSASSRNRCGRLAEYPSISIREAKPCVGLVTPSPTISRCVQAFDPILHAWQPPRSGPPPSRVGRRAAGPFWPKPTSSCLCHCTAGGGGEVTSRRPFWRPACRVLRPFHTIPWRGPLPRGHDGVSEGTPTQPFGRFSGASGQDCRRQRMCDSVG